MTFIKICGITNLEDATDAVEAGADALGFNFYPPSPRYVDPARAREIIEKLPKMMTVGVFVNEDIETVKSIATMTGISALQLHGDESPAYCAALNGWYLIKALAVNENFDERKVLEYGVDALMLDASHKKLRGGTGQVIDWSVAKRVRELGTPLFLAGGLSTENVREAIACVNPYAVDACSALEDRPGKKNHIRVKAFLAAVRG
ncbi:MAG TPA: phosphoribosylanthranilate isomerase [Pyrinomonadaceae bacterium]|jgi:phosphoribosylanthranilate isomerase|nr:phosphoribosylanthranilate isomerase [Pyrinomonadaceae bacterium]